MKNKSTLWWGCIGVLVLAGLCLLVFSIYYFSQRARAFFSHPLVLIHNPVNHDRVQAGDGLVVHATARDDAGIQRMELWLDDQLIAAEDAPADISMANMTMSKSLFPNFAGTHVVTVRAVSSKGGDGQATVMFDVIESLTGPETVIVQEGETLESIADDHEVTPEEIAASNPDIGPEGPVPGDELVIPDAPILPAVDEMPGGGDPPPAEGEAPGSASPFFELLHFAIPFTSSGERTSLRVELASLRTWQSFDSLHCYVGLGDGSPAWFPDADRDQTTDESFAPLVHGWWDVESYLAGSAAPFITWPDNQSLPLNISCVGVAGGGTDAVDLGRMELNVPPEDWDGARHSVSADGEGGQIFMEYRITRTGDTPRGVPLYLDPAMTAPSDVHLDDRRISLRWDYHPLADEEPIDGFRIYLNNTLQWIEPADARESGLPYEWFNPPCGSTYVFGVTAFRHGYPDGPESMPGATTVSTPLEGCHREIQIIYHTLETFDLGSDNSPRDLIGDVGPVYGYFLANEHQLSFRSGSADESGGGSLDTALGLNSNTTYDLSALAADSDWHFSSITSDIVEIPVGGTFEIGFHIMDSDRNNDQLVCEGMSMIYDDNPATRMFDQWHDESIRSDNGRCRLSYSFGPALGSPVGSGVAGDEPLPWLNVEDLAINENGSVEVHLRNTGTATWPWKDLDIRLQTRDGDLITTQTKSSFVLETGQETTIEFPARTLSEPYDACVVIDPEDQVLELYERSGRLSHSPVCPALPDLVISNVHFTGGEGAGALEVIVQNIGDGALENRVVSIKTYRASGSPLAVEGSWRNVTLQPGESRAFQISDIPEVLRGAMLQGYSVMINPDETFA
ncbi:MAG: LysM peptidoglycan-binding domain-containing protein, partial [Anaerolineales bacterium]|nr:LysM peptidoglycan-binding domain-containing protein [Anaerolineales bacterium]